MFRLLCLCLLTVFQTDGEVKETSVIIVGAGPSGLAAAVKLFENAITNITVIEAEDRIGGRIKSVSFGGGTVDEGAQYCHGEKGNSVYQTVKDLNILEHTHVFNLQTDKLYYSNGSLIEHELGLELNTIVTNYSEEINRTSSNPLYNSTIVKKYSSDKEKLKIVIDGIRFAHNLILMHEGSFSWETPAAGRHYKAAEGDQMMTWKSGGYQSFLNVLLKKYPDPSQEIPIENNVILNTKVEKIIWNERRVRVQTSDNATFEADHVIFTPSIGVLQAEKHTLFEPKLSEEKLQAIEALEVDAIMKIILHFPKRWWKDEDKLFYFVWNSEDLSVISEEYSSGPSKDGISWVSYIVALVSLPDNPNVLIVWVGGELIPELEQTSEEVLSSGCMYVLHKFLGKDYNVSAPDEVLRTQWYTNPNFRGTFSFEKAEYFDANISYQRRLSEPLLNDDKVPVVLFAGEATNPTLYSTVYGAVDTGRREAERIIKFARSQN